MKGWQMPLLILIAIGLWLTFGEPSKTVANFFWKNDAAPWETVDAFYYPNRNDLSNFQKMRGLDSVDACRKWVEFSAALNGDSALVRGDYECGVQLIDNDYGLPVYRVSTR